MKKLFAILAMAVMTLTANAQFEKHTSYTNLSLSGFNLSYGNGEKFRLGVDAAGGYFIEDSWMILGRFGWQHQWMPGDDVNNLKLGVGGRYYFQSNGIFLGAGLQYEHQSYVPNWDKKGNFLQIPLEVGYCYYVNHYLSLEPSIYYDMCLNQFTKGSRVGLRLGVGFYF